MSRCEYLSTTILASLRVRTASAVGSRKCWRHCSTAISKGVHDSSIKRCFGIHGSALHMHAPILHRHYGDPASYRRLLSSRYCSGVARVLSYGSIWAVEGGVKAGARRAESTGHVWLQLPPRGLLKFLNVHLSSLTEKMFLRGQRMEDMLSPTYYVRKPEPEPGNFTRLNCTYVTASRSRGTAMSSARVPSRPVSIVSNVAATQLQT